MYIQYIYYNLRCEKGYITYIDVRKLYIMYIIFRAIYKVYKNAE